MVQISQNVLHLSI